ncbi:hypothetical protein [Streptococcus oricebi]|uniref:hypothetical protein n=1 Tax=Streptococcus oricebi TaxID=1547447 RepID=UPI001AE16BB8|nr:hypothetical protein [Streptococcus oricebi]
MILQTLFIFITGLILFLISFFLKKSRTWKIVLRILGIVLMALPFLLILYFFITISQAL